MSTNLNITPLGKFNYAFIIADDDKVEGARKRGSGLFIPKTPEGYSELTTDPAKQKKYVAKAKAWVDAYVADCEKKAKDEFGAKWKASNWNRIKDGDEQDEYPGYWKVQGKTKFRPATADRLGKPVGDDDCDTKFSNGNWGLLHIDDTKAGAFGGKKSVACGNLKGLQYMCDGAPVSGGDATCDFAELEQVDVQEGDFAPLDNDDDLDTLE